MSPQSAPPSSFIQAYAAADAFSGTNSVFSAAAAAGPGTVTSIEFLPNVRVGQPSDFPLRLIATHGQPQIGVGPVILNGSVLATWRVSQGQLFVLSTPVDVDIEGVILSLFLVQQSGVSLIQSARFAVLPWVDGRRPDLRRARRPRETALLLFSNVVVPAFTVAGRVSQMITRPYIITSISYRCTTTSQVDALLRPFVSVDSDNTLPAAADFPSTTVPGEDLLRRTISPNRVERPGILAAHTKTQSVRPWKNVRFTPSFFHIWFRAAFVAITFNVLVAIEYLPPLPWWKVPALRDLARGR